jgi:hypothetical protein
MPVNVVAVLPVYLISSCPIRIVPGIISPNPAVEPTTMVAVELELGIALVKVV